ncbi:MarR family transcriptional regulator [Rothia amarae]|uniref:MarR family transcriptional regulator n=1 Tax=Rothia amarae TaxID=169480 RepID=A0A7H2BIZ4_9MICC|nr:MarR family transcriptional regulator [Rothia amarae]QNV39640.1 MarR family transcriptional regulator [Rothia amarae]
MASQTSLALDNQLCFSLYRAQRLVTRTYHQLLQELHLTYPQYLVMLALWEEGGELGMKELATRLELDSGTLTPLIKRLIALNLLQKERSAEDERRTILRLTEAGHSLHHRAEQVPEQLHALCTGEGVNLPVLKSELDSLARRLSS